MRKLILLLMAIIFLLSCQREWISAEFTKTDAGSTLPDYGITQEEPAGEEPAIIKKTDMSNSKIFVSGDNIIFPTGNKEGEIGIREGGEDELPSGPMSFTVDKNGNLHILDNINSSIKSFRPDRTLSNIISLGERAKSFIDITTSADNQLAVADMSNNLLYILSANSKSLSDLLKTIRLPMVSDFGGIYNSVKGNIYLRYGDQQSYRLNDSGLHIPFMSLISRGENLFLRTKRISSGISMLFMSSRDQNPEYKGNTESQIEIAIGLPILSISVIDTDSLGRAYLLVEADSGSKETVSVKRFVIRAGTKDEDWSKPLEIPLDVYTIPFKDIIIGEDGTVYAMLVYKDRVEVTKWRVE